MPARRLPWFKIESGATTHPKVATLSDAQFRVWVELLDAASRQPQRGRFASLGEASAVTRRPARSIRGLVDAQLVDVSDDGIWMHDWHDWQDRFPSDHPSNAGGILPEDSANAPPELRQEHPNGSPERSDKRKREREKKNALTGGPQQNRVALVIDAIRATGLEATLTARDHAAIKATTAAPVLIAEVYAAVFRGEYGDDFMRKRLSIHEAIEWINGYMAWKSSGRPKALPNGRSEPERVIIDRTGQPN